MDIDRQVIEMLRAEGLLTNEPAAEVEVALNKCRHIGSGLGILMVACKVSEGQALNMLRTASRSTARTLLELADEIVATGDLSAVLPPSRAN